MIKKRRKSKIPLNTLEYAKATNVDAEKYFYCSLVTFIPRMSYNWYFFGCHVVPI